MYNDFVNTFFYLKGGYNNLYTHKTPLKCWNLDIYIQTIHTSIDSCTFLIANSVLNVLLPKYWLGKIS